MDLGQWIPPTPGELAEFLYVLDLEKKVALFSRLVLFGSGVRSVCAGPIIGRDAALRQVLMEKQIDAHAASMSEASVRDNEALAFAYGTKQHGRMHAQIHAAAPQASPADSQSTRHEKKGAENGAAGNGGMYQEDASVSQATSFSVLGEYEVKADEAAGNGLGVCKQVHE